MSFKEPKKNKPPKRGPSSIFGSQPELQFWDSQDEFRGWEIEFPDVMEYNRTAQMRALARWILRCADWIDEQKEKEKK